MPGVWHRARLLDQSRKRGIKENDLLMGCAHPLQFPRLHAPPPTHTPCTNHAWPLICIASSSSFRLVKGGLPASHWQQQNATQGNTRSHMQQMGAVASASTPPCTWVYTEAGVCRSSTGAAYTYACLYMCARVSVHGMHVSVRVSVHEQDLFQRVPRHPGPPPVRPSPATLGVFVCWPLAPVLWCAQWVAVALCV